METFGGNGPAPYGINSLKLRHGRAPASIRLRLQAGTNAADLDGEADDVDSEDYVIFSSYWQDFCPDGWQLK